MKGGMIFFLALVVCVSICPEVWGSAAAGLDMPMGFERLAQDDSGKTWRETGHIAQPFAMARISLRAAMLRQGFFLVHDIAADDKGSPRLQTWRRRGGDDVLLMMWQVDPYTTGISWGFSVAEGSDERQSGTGSLQ